MFRRFARKRRTYSDRRRLRFRRRYRRRSRGLVHYIVRCMYETDLVVKYDSVYPVGRTFNLTCDTGGSWWPLNDQTQVLNAAKFNMYRHKKLMRASFSYTVGCSWRLWSDIEILLRIRLRKRALK